MSQEQAKYNIGTVIVPDWTDERGGYPSMSGLSAMAACPARWNACKDIPSLNTSDSIEGTKRHSLMERGADSFEDAAQESAVTRARELEAQAMEACGFHLVGMLDIREQSLAWHRLDTEWQYISGRFDRLLIANIDGKSTGLLIDYKMLHGDHGAANENLQLMGYAFLCSAYYRLDRVFVALIQPCLSRDKQLTLSCYTATNLEVIARRIGRILDDAFSPSASRIAGAYQCQYCQAYSTCKEAQSHAVVTLAETIDSGELALTPTSKGLEQVKAAAKLWDKFYGAYIESAKDMLKANPDALEGWRLASTQRKTIVNTAEAVRIMGEVLDDNSLADTLTMSLAKLADTYADAYGISKERAREVVEGILEGCIETKDTEPSLKRG
jgi:hypothetical protein